MEAKDLRIGNYVQGTPMSCPRLDYHSDGKTMVTSYGIHLIDTNQWTVEPIQLTEELLLMFGFKRFQKDFSKPGLILHTRKRGFVVRKSIPIIAHVHQLQNLYFALTGTELELK